MTLEIVLYLVLGAAVPIVTTIASKYTGPLATWWRKLVPFLPGKPAAPVIVDDPTTLVDDALRLLIELEKMLAKIGNPSAEPAPTDNPKLSFLEQMFQRLAQRFASLKAPPAP